MGSAGSSSCGVQARPGRSFQGFRLKTALIGGDRGIYRDNEKENGNYYLGFRVQALRFRSGYIGVKLSRGNDEKEREATRL